MVLAELSACFDFFLRACYQFRQGVGTVAAQGQEVWVQTWPGNSLGFAAWGRSYVFSPLFFWWMWECYIWFSLLPSAKSCRKSSTERWTHVRHTVTTLYVLKGMFLSEVLKKKRNSLAGLCSYKAPAEVLATMSNLKKPKKSAFFWEVWIVGKSWLHFIAHWHSFHPCQPFSLGKMYHPVPFLVGGEVTQQQVGLSFSPWHRRVPQGRAGGWWPKCGWWSVLSCLCAPFRAAGASSVICHRLSKWK